MSRLRELRRKGNHQQLASGRQTIRTLRVGKIVNGGQLALQGEWENRAIAALPAIWSAAIDFPVACLHQWREWKITVGAVGL